MRVRAEELAPRSPSGVNRGPDPCQPYRTWPQETARLGNIARWRSGPQYRHNGTLAVQLGLKLQSAFRLCTFVICVRKSLPGIALGRVQCGMCYKPQWLVRHQVGPFGCQLWARPLPIPQHLPIWELSPRTEMKHAGVRASRGLPNPIIQKRIQNGNNTAVSFIKFARPRPWHLVACEYFQAAVGLPDAPLSSDGLASFRRGSLPSRGCE